MELAEQSCVGHLDYTCQHNYIDIEPRRIVGGVGIFGINLEGGTFFNCLGVVVMGGSEMGV